MRIEKKIKDFLVFSGDSLLDALKRINDNQARIVFVVEDSGTLIGAVSDGDVRRWITAAAELDFGQPVDAVMNRAFVARPVTEAPAEIATHFDHKRDIIPLVDDLGRFVALARRAAEGFQLGERVIGEDSPAFIIAEVGNNHNGDLALAKRLVDLAIEAGADCVKFQMRDLTTLYSNQGKNAEAGYDLGSQYTLDLLNRFQLSPSDLCAVFDHARARGILPLCTPWDLASLHALENAGLEGYKVASADLTNNELLDALAATGKPLICSTGMSKETEIQGAVALLRRQGVPFALLHCNSTYPTPYKDVNLSYLARLKQLSGALIGYSGHERGIAIPVAAVALGARIIEKHFTVDRGMEGNDHKVSLLPEEFAEMVRQIRAVEEAMGQGGVRELTQGELINRENLAKSLVITRDLPRGAVIQRDMIAVKSPGQGLQPNRLEELVGQRAQRDFQAGDLFFPSDLNPTSAKKSAYRFARPYGIPARYHDYQTLTEGMELDFVEFHLSYHDLDIDLAEALGAPQSLGFAVHSPELFAGDHILDLASDDAAYRRHSIAELKRVVAIADALRHYFPKTHKPALVVNAGGWTPHGFLPVEARAALYERVADSLAEVDLSPVELAIQTMPPFPWHFGGQSHHNLFVDAEEIAAFCARNGHKICLDVSHSMMACNYYQWDFGRFLDIVLPYTVHLHIVDAKGVDGEGVQIGEGDVDFDLLKDKLNQHAPGVQFIPEVWQGHKNKGEGFWGALAFLERVGF
ncbi:N-acetylneuraminate synthase family protein [Rhabdochromatium marinum]|uniref:N-acetylneuraminate synthase family protein n=1 Tax=Rhabdochromatium marinum TaxID=48729 RepID=UPI00190574AE|nr:N-acetylneuraminate synthase family protein [Rhabdochromatium marinum]MBK1650483.1 acetylneuraminic acid synthetase [Rhabdochromatium marinum]